VTVVRPLDPAADGVWLEAHLDEEWGGPLQARRGEVLDARDLPALVAERDGERVGLLCYRDDGDGWWELALISAVNGHTGVGSALVAALTERVSAGRGVWVVTTNDNVDALRFYQRRGFRLRTVRPGAVDEARRSLKPQIPALGRYGIPLRDELELELLF
jgi:ribosomal protein S18 acetylase RimI-like enzyme